MKKKILKTSIICMLIITLTSINFIAIGENLVSYALDKSTELTKTNNENVAFTAYFKNDQGENQTSISKNINSSEMKLYLKIEVGKEGYFNGEFKLEESNLEFVSSQNELVNKITGDTLTLNQINAGTSSEIEVMVKPKISNNFDLCLLNMESEIKLTGIYKDSTQRDINIKGSKKIQINYISEISEENIENKLEVITNKIGTYDGVERRILQLSLKVGVKDNSYPVKHITSKISVPKINNTEPTIEKKIDLKGMTKWNYKYENDLITIDLANEPDEENKIWWTKAGSEEIILTYIYDKDVKLENSEITAETTAELYDGKTLNASKATINTAQTEGKDGIITLKGEADTSIYKGKLYAGAEKQYNTKTEIHINLEKSAETINISEETSPIETYYNKTVINKKQMLQILGEDGSLHILTTTGVIETEPGKLKSALYSVANIDKTNEEDENGNIVINYPEGISKIYIMTSEIQDKGNLVLNHTKTIKSIDKQTLANVTEIESTIKGTYAVSKGQTTGKIEEIVEKTELKETTTEAKLEINRNSLSTITENKNVEIKAILKSNAENYDLYKNPKIDIEMPADLTDIKVNSINKIYGDEYTSIKPSKAVINGRQVIRIELDGAQTEYKEAGIEGTEIIINADLTLNNRATSKQDTIKMTYTNENANQYRDGATIGTEVVGISVVSPKGLITVNNINQLDIQTIGEQEKTTKILEKSAAEKSIEVETEIINNNESTINNVVILGNFGTDGENNNLHTVLKSGISIGGIDTSKVKVYYTENEAATADLSLAENGWKETATSATDTKKYLITITEMQNAEGIKVSYNMEIPANLEYNQTANQYYEVSYTESGTGTAQQVKSTIIEITTGQGPVIEASLKAKLGTNTAENQEVKQGEIIKYSTVVKNTGTTDAQNVKVTGQVPEGTTVVKNESEQVIEVIKAGEEETVEYEVQVEKTAEVNSTITSKSTVQYDEVTKETNEVTNTVAEGNLSISIEHDMEYTEEGEIVGEEVIIGGCNTSYTATIRNLDDTEKKDIKFTWNLPEEYEISVQYMRDAEPKRVDFEIDNEHPDKNKEITISSIPAESTVEIKIIVSVKEINTLTKDIVISATAITENKDYKSNEIKNTIESNTNIEASLSVNNEGEYLNVEDIIEYTIKVKNNSSLEVQELLVQDSVPSELTVKEITMDGEKQELPDGNDVDIIINSIKTGETKEIKIKTIVNYQEDLENDTITNKASVMFGVEKNIETNEVSHKLSACSLEGDESGELGSDDILNEDGTITHTYKVSGIAWEDTNKDGERQDAEPTKEGVKVQLLNVVTNKLATDAEGKTIEATTSSNGSYTLSRILAGEYIAIFKYDTSEYKLTEYQKEGVTSVKNSKVVAKTLNINGSEETYGVTDTISIADNSVSNINIGLVKSEKFDMKLEKFISKIIVQNSAGTKTYEFNDETLAKVELDAKKIKNANVIIEYKIRVSNVGELDGYVKNIVDYIPKELDFSSELNKDWYKEGSNIYNNSLANQKIPAGSNKEITLTVTKKMTESNTGRINNIAEIAEYYNDAGITDINSTPKNKVQGENDMGSAEVIIGIKTGGPVLYTTLLLSMLVVIAVGVYFIKIKTKMEDINL